ncbi:MAG: hypothetical protein HYU39_10055 [Thaumarchaeota archaeon]|nr:hypothetical protein [Nitrososphaerota archaeon]
MFNNIIEGAFFTTAISTLDVFLGGVLVGLLITLIEAGLAVVLFPSGRAETSVRTEVIEYFRRKPFPSLLGRVALSALIYFPVYFTFGAIVSPLVIPYYTDPSLGLNLRIPSFEVMIPLEFLRGFLYVVALLPIIAVLRLPKRFLFLSVAALLFVPGAFVPFVAGAPFPLFLRVVHGLEILADSLVYGAALVYILKIK